MLSVSLAAIESPKAASHISYEDVPSHGSLQGHHCVQTISIRAKSEGLPFLPCKPTVYRCVSIVVVHVLEGGSRCRFTEVDEFIGVVGRPNKHETTTTDTTVIHGFTISAQTASWYVL